MSSYLSPGVYVEEVPSGVKPIEGAGTATGAFVGIAEKGPIGEAKLIANWTQFVNTFGGYIANGYLAYSVNQFFSEGGTRCFVVRTCHYKTITDPTSYTAEESAATLLDGSDKPSMRVMASSGGKWGDKISLGINAATDLADGFKLSVKYDDKEVESFDNLSMDKVEDTINHKSSFIRIEKDAWKEGATDVIGSGKNPKIPTKSETLKGGNDGIEDDKGQSTLKSADFEGDGKALNGLHAFDLVDDINIVAIPDRWGDRNLIIKAYGYCENRKDCFFIADPPKALDPMEVIGFKSGLNSSYCALYYPWLVISDPVTGNKIGVPPSGAVAGTYAHTDSARGVHKAPAGISEGKLDSVSDVERVITKSEHDGLNPIGINVIRSFPSSGICLWGARTISADPEWRYVNIRRLFLFLEKSIDKGTQWVVFEPNSPALWGSVIRNITSFLLRVWRDGALFGGTPEEAFYVKVDAENNPEEVRNAGQLIIEVGVAPVRPAEFIIIRISQKTAGK